MVVADGANLGQISTDDPEATPGPDRAIQRAAGRPGSCPRAKFGKGVPQPSRDARETREGTKPAHGRIPGQPAPGRLGPREVRRTRAVHAVDEVGQDRQPSHPVRQHVVEHDDQGTRVGREMGDERRRPQRLVGWQPPCHDVSGYSEEGLLVTRWRAADSVDVPGDVAARIVDPHRSAATWWCRHELLTQSGDATDPISQRVPDRARRQMRTRREPEDRPDLGRYWADVGGELHHVDRTRTLDRNIAGTLLERHDQQHRLPPPPSHPRVAKPRMAVLVGRSSDHDEVPDGGDVGLGQRYS
jgi:hypothetical protein